MKTHKTLGRTGLLGLAAGLVLGLGVASVPQDAAAWEPIKPVEIIVISAKGGGADDMARLIQAAIAKNKLSSKPFTPINKSGGTGAEALVYVKGKTGDNHTLLVAQNKFYTTPLNNPGLGIDISTFTPVGRRARCGCRRICGRKRRVDAPRSKYLYNTIYPRQDFMAY